MAWDVLDEKVRYLCALHEYELLKLLDIPPVFLGGVIVASLCRGWGYVAWICLFLAILLRLSPLSAVTALFGFDL